MGRVLHTGWVQSQDCWIDPGGGFGFGRENLGVFNPQPQPVFSTDGTIALLLDGELYDTGELRRSLLGDSQRALVSTDADLALQLYISRGPEGFKQLHGMFCIAVWDAARRSLILANDRFGLRPLYIAQRPGWFAFAAEMKALLTLSELPCRVDDSAVADFFSFGYILGDKTLCEDIRLLPPASVWIVRENRIHRWQYWSLEYGPDAPHRAEADWIDEMLARLERAVERRVRGRENVALPLSGGIDSRLLLAVLTTRLDVRLPAFTYGLPDSQDVVRAARLARKTGIRHTWLGLPEDYLVQNAELAVERTEGQINCFESHGFLLNALRPEFREIMLGNGGDSFFLAFRAYRRKLLQMSGDPVDDFYQATVSPFDDGQVENLFTGEYYSRIKGQARENLRASLAEMRPNSLDNLYDAHRLREFNRRGLLSGLFTTNTHLEYTEPYYDYDLVDFALSLPVFLRWERRLPLLALSRAAPDLARIEGGPLESGWTAEKIRERVRVRLKKALPGSISARMLKPPPKPVSFTDLNRLLSNGSLGWVKEILLDPRTLERGVFKPGAIGEILSGNPSSGQVNARQLGAMVTFELWNRLFVDGQKSFRFAGMQND